MPKKKRQFIDKKNAQTFAVVHRSQRDPLAQVRPAARVRRRRRPPDAAGFFPRPRPQDESAPQMVLAPTFTGNDRARWRRADRRAGEGTTVHLDEKGAAEVRATTRAPHGEARCGARVVALAWR